MKNQPTTEIKQIEIEITEISNKALRQIKTTTDAISFIYHALLNFHSTELPPLQTDSLPFKIEDTSIDNSPVAMKKRSMDWLFKKAFEEFILGLTESLIEAHKFVNFAALSISSRDTKKMTEEEIDAEIAIIRSRPHKLPFPVLLDQVEKELGIELPLKREILSINSVRNCLVHRNSVVSKLDLRDELQDCLHLQYLDLVTFYRKGEDMIEMKWADKEDELVTNALQFREIFKSIEFKKGEQVSIDQNIFNGVAYTCTIFLQNLQHFAIVQNAGILDIKSKTSNYKTDY